MNETEHSKNQKMKKFEGSRPESTLYPCLECQMNIGDVWIIGRKVGDLTAEGS